MVQKLFLKMPMTCPVCGGSVHKMNQDTSQVSKCINIFCEAQKKERIRHFVSKKAFDIEGLGKKIVIQLVDEGLISTFSDIFELQHEQIAALERMGNKSADNLIKAIDASRKISLQRFIYALGIEHSGEYAARVISQTFPNIEELMAASQDDLKGIHGIGAETAAAVHSFFADSDHQKLISDLLDAGVRIDADAPSTTFDGFEDSPFKDQRVVLSGTLQQMTRTQAKEKLTALGARVTSSVSASTNILIAGEKAGSKLKKAQELSIRIMTEDEFVNFLS